METNTSPTTTQKFLYPGFKKVFGIVVDGHTPSALIKVGLDALSKVEVDLLIFLCLAPHDIRTRTDWEELIKLVQFKNGKSGTYEVMILHTAEELLHASLNMRVIRLPDESYFAGL